MNTDKNLTNSPVNCVLTSMLTLDDFKNFFETSGISVKNIELCGENNGFVMVKFSYNSKILVIWFADTGIVIHDPNFYEDYYKNINVESLVEILENHWFKYMHKMYGYKYSLTYPHLLMKTIKKRNYVSHIDLNDFKDFIVDILSNHRSLANYFFGITKEDIDIREIESFFVNERLFIVKKISTGDMICIKFSDFEIAPISWALTKYLKFMHNHFGESYLLNLRENAITRLHKEEVPKYVERATQKIDETIKRISEM